MTNFLDPRLPPRFWARAVPEPNSGCWLWLGALNGPGYGLYSMGALREGIPHRTRRVHRIAYEALVGPIPEGLHLDHLCRLPCCFNPAHLEPVTTGENTRRGVGCASRTHCPAGHPYDESNTYRVNGRRQCRACNVARWRRRRRLLAAAKT